MSDVANVAVGPVYHEGGDVYRPFTIVPVPTHINWLTPNLAFYQSTGRSNSDPNNELREHAWFPTIGLLNENSTLQNFFQQTNPDNSYPAGLIIKMISLNKVFDYNSWAWYGGIVRDLQLMNSTNEKIQQLSILYTLSPEISADVLVHVFNFLLDYFNFWWQIQISAQLNGGLWKKYTALRKFVLNYDLTEYSRDPPFDKNVKVQPTWIPPHLVKRLTPLETISISYTDGVNTRDDSAPENSDEINQYLINNHAFFDFSNMTLPVKKIRNRLINNTPQELTGGQTPRRKKSIKRRTKSIKRRTKSVTRRKKSMKRRSTRINKSMKRRNTSITPRTKQRERHI
tara:strand:+ start:3107 stop:4132 length:1026 start_codon:yes stop_codon:yes gene_type:complete